MLPFMIPFKPYMRSPIGDSNLKWLAGRGQIIDFRKFWHSKLTSDASSRVKADFSDTKGPSSFEISVYSRRS
jgi:hypothetical protein